MKLKKIALFIFSISISCLLVTSCTPTRREVKRDPTGGSFRATSSGLFKIRQDGNYGYIDNTGKVVIKPQFPNAGEFSEGLAWVCVGDGCEDWSKGSHKFGFIDKEGKFVIIPQLIRPGRFQWVLLGF